MKSPDSLSVRFVARAFRAGQLAAFCLIGLFLSELSCAQVRATLVSAAKSVQPGRTFTVALEMEHQPTWHSYWVNAGTGYPTRIKWQLPAGWSAGDIQWPTPILIKDSHGTVTGHGYDGVLYLQVPITPAADAKPGTKVTLEAAANWLMCADVCIPGKQDLTLTLPVSADAPQVDASIQAEIAKMPMPHDAQGWKIAAVHGNEGVTLHVAGSGEIREPHFFSEDPFIAYEVPQGVVLKGARAKLQLPFAEEPQVPERLVGIFGYVDGTGEYRGLKVDVPFTSDAAAVALVGASPDGHTSAGGANSSSGAAGASGGLTVRVVLFALLGGLILNLMPCVFPVLGIKVLGFINQAGGDRRKVTMHGLTFTLGVLIAFCALAALLAVLRAGGQQLGWGFQLQSAPFVFVLAVIMLVFALSLSGVFEFGLRATGIGAELQMKQGYVGSFFAGVLATVVATPCSAPFLAPALGAALALPTGESFVVFSAIGIGLSVPYLLLSAFPQAIRILPKPGRWMETFKQVMAFPLYATVGYLVWVLAGQTSENGLLAVLFSLTVIAMGVWMYGRYGGLSANRGHARLAFAAALVFLAVGLYVGWPQAAKAGDLNWEPWSSERVADLQRQGRGIYVDFTARWCATCQANKKIVFASGRVREVFRKKNIALLKGDWTNSDPRITAELAHWGRSAVPFNLLYLPGQEQPKILPELLTPAIVLGAIESSSSRTVPPSVTRAALDHVQALEKDRKMDEALAAAFQAVEADPDFLDMHDWLARFPRQRLRELAQQDPDHAPSRVAQLHPELKVAKEAIRAKYEKWLQRFPDSRGVLYGMGRYLYSQQRPEAREYLLKFVERDPTNPEVFTMLSSDASLTGDQSAATEYSRKAMRLEPDNAQYALNYAYDAPTGEREAAFKNVVTRFPNTKVAAAALAELGEEATDDAHRAMYLEQLRTQFPPGESELHAYDMGMLYEVYVRTDPDKAVGLAQQMQLAKISKEWQSRVDLARSFIEVKEKLAAGKGNEALALLDKLTPEEDSSNAAMIERMKARVMADAGHVQAGYRVLLAWQAKAPDEETGAAMQAIGAKLGRTPAQVQADLKSAIYTRARPAPAFELESYASPHAVSLAKLRGKVVLLTFWFPGCSPCAEEFPHFETVMQKLRQKSDDVVYVAVNIVRDQDAYVLPRIAKKQYTFTPLMGTEDVQGAKGYDIPGAPTNFVIDRSGKIVYRGFMIDDARGEQMLQRMIESVL